MARSKGGPMVKVDGLKELQREIRRTQDKELKKEMRGANKSAAEIVAKAADPPVQSGRLKKSVKAAASNSSAKVKAGTAARVPYAGAIHFGWPRRNIRANRFLNRALWKTRENVRESYADALEVVTKALSSR